MKTPWIIPVATLLVGLAAGYISGKNTSSGSDSAAAGGDTELRTRSDSRFGNSGSSRSGDADSRRVMRSLEEIDKLTGSSNRIMAMIDYYEGLSIDQFEEEAGKMDELPLSDRIVASFLLFSRWAEVDPTSAMGYTNTMGWSGFMVKPTVLQSWASVDPANAARYYAENPREFAMMGMGRGRMSGESGSQVIASEWAKQDPDAALAWANTLTTDKDRAIEGVMSEIAKTDPAKAAKMLGQVDSEVAERSIRTIAESYGASNFSEAQSWIQTLPAEEQASAMASAISGLAKTDPEGAAAQVAMMEDGAQKNRAVADVVEVMAKTSPESAADFLANNGSEDAQERSMRELMPQWVAKDPGAALTYAAGLPKGDVRDSALQSYVWSNQQAEPADLIKVVESIDSERDRDRAMWVTTRRWMQEDPDAAKAYIEQSDMVSDRIKRSIAGDGDRD